MFVAQSTKFRTNLLRESGQNFSSQEANNSSSLGPLRNDQLRNETQCIVLKYRTDATAFEQGTTSRAVEKQKNGESALSLLAVVNWCRANPRVRAEFMRLMGCSDGETDPDFHQALHLLINKFTREQTSDEAVEVGEKPECAALDLFGGK